MIFVVLLTVFAIGYLNYYIVSSVYINRFSFQSTIIPQIELYLTIAMFFLSTFFPSFLAHATVLMISVTQISWREHCRKFRFRDGTLTNDHAMMTVFDRFKYGQKVFVLSICMLKKIDRVGIKVFTVSVAVNIIMNVIGFLELIIGQLKPVSKGFIVVTMVFQLAIIISVMIIFMQTSKQLYTLNGSILHYHVKFMKHSFSKWRFSYKIRALLRWHHFVEVVHTRRKFVFRLGGLGKITSSNIVGFMPIYTALLFRFIPIIIGEESEYSLKFMLCHQI